MMRFEHTDLFGGEANYGWVRRAEFPDHEGLSRRAIVRRAKKWADFTGRRCTVDDFGDMIRIDAEKGGLLQVVFVTFEY